MDKKTMKVKGKQNWLITNILQNICFCVLQKKEIYIGLERHEVFSFRI